MCVCFVFVFKKETKFTSATVDFNVSLSSARLSMVTDSIVIGVLERTVTFSPSGYFHTDIIYNDILKQRVVKRKGFSRFKKKNIFERLIGKVCCISTIACNIQVLYLIYALPGPCLPQYFIPSTAPGPTYKHRKRNHLAMKQVIIKKAMSF